MIDAKVIIEWDSCFVLYKDIQVPALPTDTIWMEVKGGDCMPYDCHVHVIANRPCVHIYLQLKDHEPWVNYKDLSDEKFDEGLLWWADFLSFEFAYRYTLPDWAFDAPGEGETYPPFPKKKVEKEEK